MKVLEVNRNFYIFCLVLLSLMVATVVVALMYYLKLGDSLYATSGYKTGYAFGAILTVIDGLFFLRYVHFKNFRATFYIVMISMVVSSFHFYVVFSILNSGNMQEYFAATYLLALGFGLLYAISLIFSRASTRPYLKLAGILIFIIHVMLIAGFLWGTRTTDVQLAEWLKSFQVWVGYGSNVLLLLFVMNYLDEIKQLGSKKVNNESEKLNLTQT